MTTTVSSQKRGLTLGQAFAEFVRHPSPWMIASVLVGALVARVWVGDWALSDLVAPLVYVALFPVMEWVIHVFVLHWKPRRLGRWTVDTLLARKHREHHVAPRDVPLVFIPWQTLIGVIAFTVAAPLLLFPTTGQALTFMMTVGVMGLAYEWIHYLVHTDYKPRTRAYRAVYKHHRLHHFKNENYWMTVTTANTADRLFGTMPSPETVPTSPTAKNLHGLA
jgi:Fatty acid hydroxylase superfamily